MHKAVGSSATHDLPEPNFGVLTPKSPELVICLAQQLEWLLSLNEGRKRKLTTQIYVLSSTERNMLQQHLINSALSTSLDTGAGGEAQIFDAVKTCIGAICEGSNLLATVFQPTVLSSALLGFLHKKQGLTREHLRVLLERLNVPYHRTDTKETMRLLLEGEINRLQSENDQKSGFNLGSLPRVIAFRDELAKLIALPSPGYWNLKDAVASLLSKRRRCPSDEEIFETYKSGDIESLKGSLVTRNRVIYDLLKSIRRRVDPSLTGGSRLLLGEARPLSSHFMDICQESTLRKLFYMHQVNFFD